MPSHDAAQTLRPTVRRFGPRASAQSMPLLTGAAATRHRKGIDMIILGIILLAIGFIAHIAILWTLGIVVLAIGAVLFIVGSTGREIAGRRHYW